MDVGRRVARNECLRGHISGEILCVLLMAGAQETSAAHLLERRMTQHVSLYSQAIGLFVGDNFQFWARYEAPPVTALNEKRCASYRSMCPTR